MMKKFLPLILLMMPTLAMAATDKTISAVQLNNQAIGELEKELVPAAQDHLIQALGKSPENSTLHLNLGFAFEKANQAEKAQASYQQALKFAKDPETKFDADFNLGHLAQKAEKTEEALAFYQAALLENPDSKETKTNIELLMKQDENKQNKDNKDNKDKKDQKDNKDQNKDQKDQKDQNKDQKDGQQNKDQKDKDKDGKQNQDKKQYSNQQAPKPQFKSDQLTQGDVNKILGELKQQEQKIRAEYNRKEVKEKPNEKDW